LLECNKFDAIRKVSAMSRDCDDGAEESHRSSTTSIANNKPRRQSFLGTGKFEG